MRLSKICIVIAVMVAIGCSSEPKEKMVHEDIYGPVMLTATYNTGANTLTLEFNEDVQFTDLTSADFTLPVASDSLGTGVTFTDGASKTEIVINLGIDHTLTATGSFNPDWIQAGDSSAISIAFTGLSKITDTVKKKNPAVSSPLGSVDISL